MLLIVGVLTLLLGLTCPAMPSVADALLNRVTQDAGGPVSERSLALHEQLWIADLHADPLLWGRNLMQRSRRGHVDMPRLIEGNTAFQVFSIVSKVPFLLNMERNGADSDMITFLAVAGRWPTRTWSSLVERALYQAERLQKFAERSGGTFTIIKSRADLEAYEFRRQSDRAVAAGLLAVEGAQVLEGNLANVDVLFRAGVRMMAPTHFFDTEVGGSAHGLEKGGLTDFGRRVISRMQELGMIVDLAHASSQTIEDILEMASKPVVVSHTGVIGTCPGTRNLSDDLARTIAASGGIIGIAYFKEATCGSTLDAAVAAIRYAVNLVGVEHVGLGSDFDGAVATPIDAARLPEITHALSETGFSDEEIRLVMGANVRRVLRQVLP